MSKILDLREAALLRLPIEVAKKWRKSEVDTHFLGLALCGEAGELGNLIKKEWRDGVDLTEQIRDELADVRIYLELTALLYGIPGDLLDDQVAKKLDKIVQREIEKAREVKANVRP